MKLFKLIWIVRDGSCEYFQNDWMVFENDDNATQFGIAREVEDNTEKVPDHLYSKKEREKIRLSLSNDKKKYFHFVTAFEVEFVEGNDGNCYDISINKRVINHDEKKGIEL
jgi:hypothetical protein